MTIFVARDAILLDGHLPLTLLVNPFGSGDFGVQLNITIEVPFLDRPLEIGLDLRTTRIESAPIRIWVKGKRL